jgi:glutathione synthase/RimK-type ligase-like ATP-grasp enzyme
MNDNLRCLTTCCKNLGVDFQILHESGNLVEVFFDRRSLVFSNWATPLNPHSIARMCMDKEYAYRYFRQWVRMPRTAGYLDPGVRDEYRGYLELMTHHEIVSSIHESFEYPVMVKRNSGSRGIHVYRCETQSDVSAAISGIFRQGQKGYDYVAIAQEFIEIQREFRVVSYRGDIAFMYEKRGGLPGIDGNISPLHTEGGTARLVSDPREMRHVSSFLTSLHTNSSLDYGGLDILLDAHDQLWLLEVNSAPSFTFFIRYNGEDQVVSLYERILKDLASGASLF